MPFDQARGDHPLSAEQPIDQRHHLLADSPDLLP
jgi:hypothetical protein